MDKVKASFNLELWNKKFSNQVKERGLIRKLSLIHDPEAKTRIVGVLDY